MLDTMEQHAMQQPKQQDRIQTLHAPNTQHKSDQNISLSINLYNQTGTLLPVAHQSTSASKCAVV